MDQSQMIAERLERLIAERGTNNRAVAVAAGMSPTGVRDIILRKTKNPTVTNMMKIADVLGVSISEIVGDTKAPALEMLPADAAPPPDATLVPVYDVSAAAGNGVVVDDYEMVARQLAFPPNYLRHITTTNPKDLAIISVTGGSMTPTLHHDDIVMVDTTKKNISYDGMFVIRHDGLLKVKRLHWGEDKKTIKVVSDNRLQHPEEEHSVSEIEVIGRVVWVGAKQP